MRVHVDFDLGELQRALAGLHRRGGRHDDVLRNAERPRRARRRARLRRRGTPCGAASCRRWRRGRSDATPSASFSVLRVFRSKRDSVEPRRRRRRGRRHRRSGVHDEEDAGTSGVEPGIGARGKRQGDDALLDFVEVDAHRLGRRLGERGVAAPVPPRPPRPPPAAGLGALLLIALGRQRRRDIVGQHRQVDAAGDLVFVAASCRARWWSAP